jgi:mono/diheme cytochrome c family protein
VEKRLPDQKMMEIIHTGKGRMPSFPNIQDERLSALLNYIKSGKDFDTQAVAGSSDKELQHDQIASEAAFSTSSKDTRGATVYAKQCAICHGDHLEGIAPSFPSLLGIGSRMTAKQIINIVQTGRGRMPGFGPARISEADMKDLMRFLGASDILPGQAEPSIAEMDRYRFTGYHKFHDQDGYPAVAPPWGTLNAIDLNTGKYLWKVPLGYYPELAAKGMASTGTENYGGPIVTAGGLVVIGATVFDNKIRAFHSRTGKLLWSYELPSAGAATPTTYMVDGKQYIVIAAGGSKLKHANRGYYVAFALK